LLVTKENTEHTIAVLEVDLTKVYKLALSWIYVQKIMISSARTKEEINAGNVVDIESNKL
jgi:hypothetical protein